jgi:hypothetical protein
MLLNALGGLGFERKKSDTKVPTGILYGPDDVTYYSVLDVDKKKKKNSRKGLLGVSQPEQLIYFLEPEVQLSNQTKEIIYTIPVKSLKKHKEKKTKLVLEWENEAKEYEGEKSDIQGVFVHIDTAFNNKASPVSTPKPQQNLPVRTSSIHANGSTSPVQSVPIQVVPPSPAHASPVTSQVAVALYDYDPQEEGELFIRENDTLIVLDTSDPDWWMVKHLKKAGEGLVPATYVEVNIC